ncbi:hypothetical protein ACU5RK_001559 [Campylobacter upsaliensis]
MDLKLNRAFCKAAAWALARLKGKIWQRREHLGFGSFSGALLRGEKNIKIKKDLKQ